MARKTIYVTGHKNPDSDAIISAMAYAYLKQQLGFDAIAVRLGPINPETEYILSLFNEFAPPLATDIKTRVRDIDFDDVITCSKQDDVRTVLQKMIDNHKKVIAIVDEKKRLLGISSISDLTKPVVLDSKLSANLLARTDISYIVDGVKGRLLVDGGNKSNGEVYVASFDNLDCLDKIAVLSNNPEREMQALHAGARVMIVCGDSCPKEVEDMARQKGVSLILTDLHIYNVIRALDFAYPIEFVMTTEVTTFNYDDYIDDVKRKINNSRFRSYPIIDAYQHVIGMVSRYHVFQHSNRNLILVDHNELSQSIEGAEQANILEIIDHHRIGGIKTASPVTFRNEQTGSCATIITEIFEEKGVEIPTDLAGLLCCAILSDTVNFRSVTCTDKDKVQAEKMARIAGLDMEELGPKILTAGTKLANRSVDSILNLDLKRFTVGKNQIAVGQANIASFESIVPIKDAMNKHLSEYAKGNGLSICMMVFSLIDGTGSYVLSQGDASYLVGEAFEDLGLDVDGFTFLPKVMSRKLQIIPRITEIVEGRG